MKKRVYVNDKKCTVVTVLTDKYGKYVGKAKCAEGDNYDSEIGKEVSLLKAKVKKYNRKNVILNNTIKWLKKQIKYFEGLIDSNCRKVDEIMAKLEKYD